MKRYILFISSPYYPDGGMKDFVFDTDDLNEINNFLEECHKKDEISYDYENIQIFDQQINEIIQDNKPDFYWEGSAKYFREMYLKHE